VERAVQTDRQIVTRILLPVVAFALVAILFAALGLFWSTWQSDRLSMEREIRATQLAIDRSIQELAREQEMIAVRDGPLLQLRKPQPDWQWIDQAVGVRLHETFGHDQVYILNGRDEPVYAMVDGARVPAARFRSIEPAVARMVDVVRGQISEANHRHDRNPGQERPEDGSVLTTDKAVHESHLVSIDGAPAAVSVMLMRPLSQRVQQAPGTEPVAISLRFFDTAFFQSLSRTTLIENPRFSRTGDVAPGERALILKSDHGEAIGTFIWTPERAGSQVFRVVGPVTAGVLLVMLLLLGGLSRSLYRTFSHLRREILVREEAEMRAEALARHDSLTGLPNRRMFLEELDTLRAPPPDASGASGALLLANVDAMRALNDTYGFTMADEMLVQLAGRLKGLAGHHGLVARTGGDEFSLFIAADAGDANVPTVAERICAALQEPFTIDSSVVQASVTVGVALYPAHGATPLELINAADAALGRGKRESRSGCTFYDPQSDASGRPATTARELNRRLERRPRFEIAEVTDTVIRSTCRSAAEWPADTALCLCMPAAQLKDPWLSARLLAVLNSTGLPPTRLIVEIPEAALIDGPATCMANLSALEAAGVRLSIGDVAGHVSPASYRKLRFDQIRIDALKDALTSLLADTGRNKNAA
jgi:diguanylate cyclase (GGDEF)-like protein